MPRIKKIGTYSDNGKIKLLSKYEPSEAELERQLKRQLDDLLGGMGMGIGTIKRPPQKMPMRLLIASQENPVEWGEGSKWRENWWAFKGNIYKLINYIDEEHTKLLIIDEFNKEENELERLKQQNKAKNDEEHQGRIPIPESVRIEVWRRDEGKCVKCGSRENLEFDHIIPVSKGGSNTARNIELLCEKHNRSKGANIG